MKGSNRSEVNFLNGVVARKASEINELAPVNETLTKIFLEILQDKRVRAAYSRNPILLVETINKEKRICYDEIKS